MMMRVGGVSQQVNVLGGVKNNSGPVFPKYGQTGRNEWSWNFLYLCAFGMISNEVQMLFSIDI